MTTLMKNQEMLALTKAVPTTMGVAALDERKIMTTDKWNGLSLSELIAERQALDARITTVRADTRGAATDNKPIWSVRKISLIILVLGLFLTGYILSDVFLPSPHAKELTAMEWCLGLIGSFMIFFGCTTI